MAVIAITILVAALAVPASAGPDGRELGVSASNLNWVTLDHYPDGAQVTISFTDPEGGPTCPPFVIRTPQPPDDDDDVSGQPGCDLQPGWIATATDATTSSELLIQDVQIIDYDLAADTVTVWVDDLDGTLEFGCDGLPVYVHVIRTPDLVARAVYGEGLSVVDFSTPGSCPGPFDDVSYDLTEADGVNLVAIDEDGDTTRSGMGLGWPIFECPTGDIPFVDVSTSSYAYEDLKCIYGLGITRGTSPTTYSPYDFVTREQMASFLARLYSVTRGTPEVPILGWVSDTPFGDLADSADWARADIGRIFGLGITTGTSPTTYAPKELVTREQMASFLARLLRAIKTLRDVS